jgi:hypothetical protein
VNTVKLLTEKTSGNQLRNPLLYHWLWEGLWLYWMRKTNWNSVKTKNLLINYQDLKNNVQ